MVQAVCSLHLYHKLAELKSLYVGKNFRNQGLGENLTKLAVKFASLKGRSEIILWSDTRFIEAHKLYEKIGFKRLGERELDDINKSSEFGYKRNTYM